MNTRIVLILAAVVIGAWWTLSSTDGPAPQPCPGPNCPAPAPEPTPDPAPPKPRRPRGPWGPRQWVPVGALHAPLAPRIIGEPEPAVDLLSMPADHRKRNIASSGLGCCTFRSAEYCARWAQVPALYDLPEWMRQNGIAGGGTPQKQASVIHRCAQARGLPVPVIYQYEGRDTTQVAACIMRILKTRRPCGVTWGGNHMLCCVYCDATRIGILDNNAPDRVQWYSYEDGMGRIMQGGGGWVFALRASPPPPPPAGIAWPRTGCCCPCGPSCSRNCALGGECRCGRGHVQPIEPIEGGLGLWRWPAGEQGERYWIGGRVVSRQQWEDEFPDDSARPHLTVIAPKDQQRAALAQLGGATSGYHVQSYEPGHWATACGFQSGHVYVQDSSGRVLLRAPVTASDLLARLRRRDPNYRPETDPDGSAVVPSLPSLSKLRDWAKKNKPQALLGAAAAVGAGLWLSSRQKGGPQQKVAPRATVPAPIAATQAVAVPPGSLDELALKIGREEVHRRVAAAQVLAAAQTSPAVVIHP